MKLPRLTVRRMMMLVALAALALGCVEAKRRWTVFEAVAADHDGQAAHWLRVSESTDQSAFACRERADILRRADAEVREQAADRGIDFPDRNDYTRQAGEWDRKGEELWNQARGERFKALDHARKAAEFRGRWL